MRYDLKTTSAACKSLKKLPAQVRNKLIISLDYISLDPFLGKRLKSPFKTLYSYKIVINGVHYRIIHQVIKFEIIVHFAATRENIYKKIKKLNLK